MPECNHPHYDDEECPICGTEDIYDWESGQDGRIEYMADEDEF